MDQLELINAAKELTGSDYATAKAIGITRQGLSTARLSGTKLDLSTVGALAELCGNDPLRTIAEVAATREGQTQRGRNWRRWSGAAILIVGLCAVSTVSVPTTTYATAIDIPAIHYAHLLGLMACAIIGTLVKSNNQETIR